MAIFILGPDLNPAEMEVLLKFSKVYTCCVTVSYLIVFLLLAVFKIAYCNFVQPQYPTNGRIFARILFVLLRDGFLS